MKRFWTEKFYIPLSTTTLTWVVLPSEIAWKTNKRISFFSIGCSTRLSLRGIVTKWLRGIVTKCYRDDKRWCNTLKIASFKNRLIWFIYAFLWAFKLRKIITFVKLKSTIRSSNMFVHSCCCILFLCWVVCFKTQKENLKLIRKLL